MFRPESPAPSTRSTAPSTGRVVFGAATAAIERHGGTETLTVALPVLAGPAREELLLTAGEPHPRHGCAIFENAHETAGFLVAPAEADLENAARDLYRQIFSATAGRQLYRLWNYVPRINVVESGLENYRRFCRGRSVAFEQHFGAGFQRQLPAASAVGATQGALAIAFLAGDAAARHVENPRQVPAFEYPVIYGPRAPSFSRATLVTSATGRQLFISGTAAIRGHATIAPDDLAGQLACTRENLELIAQAAGAGKHFGAGAGWQRTFKVYVRHAADFAAVEADLQRHFLRDGDSVTYLQADLCRSDLLVEIEAVLRA